MIDYLLLFLASAATVTHAEQLTAQELSTCGATFAGRIGRASSRPYLVQPGSFTFQNVPSDCEKTKRCMGGSKATPLGFALVPFSFEEKKRSIVNREKSCLESFMCGGDHTDSLSAAFRLEKSEAIVLIGMTPPASIGEYTITTSLYSRDIQHHPPAKIAHHFITKKGQHDWTPACSDESERCVLSAPFGSLSSLSSGSTLFSPSPSRPLVAPPGARYEEDESSKESSVEKDNSMVDEAVEDAALAAKKHISVEKEEWRGTFGQPIAIIVSNSKNTTWRMKEGLIDAGISKGSINVMPIPSKDMHLSLDEHGDTYLISLKMFRPSNHALLKQYINGPPPFQVFRFTPMPEEAKKSKEGSDDNDKEEEEHGERRERREGGAGGSVDDKQHATYSWEEVKTEATSPSIGAGGTFESFRDSSGKSKNLNLCMDILEQIIIKQLHENIVTATGDAMSTAKQTEGKQCIQGNLQCHARPDHDPEMVVVSRNTRRLVLGGDARGGTSILMYGILHRLTNLTTERIVVSIVDVETGENVLTLDDRSFSFSTQRLLGSTSAKGAPLYFLKFALYPGRYGCGKAESNCFVLGEHRNGRELAIFENTYVKIGANDDNVRRSMIPTRIMTTYHDRGQPSSLVAKEESELLSSGAEEIDAMAMDL